MARLTSRQRQAVIARYLAGESIASLAKEYNVTYQALAKQVKKEKVQERLKNSKIEQEMTMLAFMQSKREQTQEIIDALFARLEEKMDKATFKDCVAGIKELAGLYLEREEKTGETEQTTPINIIIQDTRKNDE